MRDVACASGVELLMEYLEGTLSADVRASLEAHVAGCPRCAAFIASYRETPRILRDTTDTALPPELRQRLRTFLRDVRRRPHLDN